MVMFGRHGCDATSASIPNTAHLCGMLPNGAWHPPIMPYIVIRRIVAVGKVMH